MLFSKIKAKWIKGVFLTLLSFGLVIPAFAQEGEAASTNLHGQPIV